MVIRKINKFITGLFVLLSLSTVLLSFLPSIAKPKAEDNNPAAWILCMSSTGKSLYNAATTDFLPYSFRSKSAVTQTDSIDGFLNEILDYSGYNFDKVNKEILGHSVYNTGQTPLTKVNKKGKTVKPAKNPNKSAQKVNPFDRFGVEGLTWSSYAGEWKYYQVDGCSEDQEVSNTTFGVYYKNRKEPKATYGETANSLDPRTIQFRRGTGAAWLTAFNDILANFVFSISKIIVTLTIAFISFSFTDVLTVFNFASSQGGITGLFKSFYTGLFLPLSVIAMAFTGIYVFCKAILMRQIREALINKLGLAILCLFVGALIASNPSRWVSFPNDVATYGQALVVDGLSSTKKGDSQGLCTTNVGKMTENVSPGFGKNAQKELQAVGTNMRSMIGCKMWQVFLLRPWVQGQFGTTYGKLANSNMHNHNAKWVGTPTVPLGKNTFSHNWALFQLSTQTNAHAQLSDTGKYEDKADANFRKTIDGTNVDWYRIVDGLSNYDEKDSGDGYAVASGNGTSEISDQLTSLQPSQYWQAWIGNKSTDRYGVAFLSVLFAIIGSIGPLVFAVLAAIYGVGVSLMMAVAPIFLLFGMWAGAGTEIMKGWFSSLLSFMVKKVVAAALIILSFNMTMSIMGMVDKIGWIKSILLLVVITGTMVKSRSKIFDLFANFNFGMAFNPVQPFNDMFHKNAKRVKHLTAGAVGVGLGGYRATKEGMTFGEGASIAFGTQVRLHARRSEFGRAGILSYDLNTGSEMLENLHCANCGRLINPGETAYKSRNGDYYCEDCMNDIPQKDELQEFTVPNVDTSNEQSRDIHCAYCKKLIPQGTTAYKTQNGGYLCSECANDLEDRDKYVKKTVIKHSVFGSRNSEAHAPLSTLRRANALRKQNLGHHISFDKTNNPTRELEYNVKFNDMDGRNRSWLSYSTVAQRMNLTRKDDGSYTWSNSGVNDMISNNMSALDRDIDEHAKLFKVDGNRANGANVPEPLQDYIDPILLNEAWTQQRYDIVKEGYRNAWANWWDDNAAAVSNANKNDKESIAETLGYEIKDGEFVNPQSKAIDNGDIPENRPDDELSNIQKFADKAQKPDTKRAEQKFARNHESKESKKAKKKNIKDFKKMYPEGHKKHKDPKKSNDDTPENPE